MTETAPAVRKSVTWGYLLEAPGRPSVKAQREFMRAAGIDISDFGPVWSDRAERGSTRPQHQLVERMNLLSLAVQPGDTVMVSEPFCLGLSGDDAEWFSRELLKKGILLSVAGKLMGADSIPGLAAEVARKQNAHHVRAHRKPELKQLPPVERGRQRRFEKKPCVYRHFDKDGALLYVGVCGDYSKRRQHHRGRAPWRSLLHREELEYYETMREALDTERTAIHAERPIHNQRRLPPKKQKPST